MTRIHNALFSIHDVMPDTMGDVGVLLELCHRHGIEKVTLLVVPGGNWQSGDLQQLRIWQNQGCELAGHGLEPPMQNDSRTETPFAQQVPFT